MRWGRFFKGFVMRKIVAAAIVLCVSFSVAMAEEFRATISKVDGSKVTLTKRLKKGEKGEETTLTAVDDVKVLKSKFNKETMKFEAGDAIESGLKNEMFSNASTKAVNARVSTNDDGKITEIRVFEGFKGKGKRKKDITE